MKESELGSDEEYGGAVDVEDLVDTGDWTKPARSSGRHGYTSKRP